MRAPNRLKQLREASGLSQRALAQRLGVASNAVARWERGEHAPSVYGALRVSRALGVPVESIWLDAVERDGESSRK